MVDNLQQRTEKAEERKHETAVRQITKAQTLFYPNNNLQEREMNFFYFSNKYGIDMFKWLFDELAINKIEHQILEL